MWRMIGPLTLVALLELAFVTLCVVWGPADCRRPRFWTRVTLTGLAIAASLGLLMGVAQVGTLSAGVASKLLTTLMLIGVAVVICLPSLFYRPMDAPPDSGLDGGGGDGPSPPDPPHDHPRGGVPLPDADQARARVRDHRGPAFPRVPRRRPVHEPGRAPAKTR